MTKPADINFNPILIDMKFFLKSAFALTVTLSGAVAQQPKPATGMRDAVTHDQLVLNMRKAAQNDPMRNLKPAAGEDPSLVNQPKDLVAASDIISFGGNTTLVPKRAILAMPKGVADRVKYQPGTKIISWLDFYTLNRGWITTVEVSRPQAEGNVPLDEKIAQNIAKSSNLVVATYQGGPISVLPPKAPADPAKPAPNAAVPTATASTNSNAK
jgi:hypothetical protein